MIEEKIKQKLEILAQIEDLENQVQQQLKDLRKQKTLQCKHCNTHEQIQNISVIQTLWYTPPSGCIEGGYWNDGELNYICTTCNVRNRLLFQRTKKEIEEASKDFRDWDGYRNKKKEFQFSLLYKPLFKEIIDIKDKDLPGSFVNNDMLDFEVL